MCKNSSCGKLSLLHTSGLLPSSPSAPPLLTATSVPVAMPPWSGFRSGWLLSGPLAPAAGAARSSSSESGTIRRSRRVRSVEGAAAGVGAGLGGLEVLIAGGGDGASSLIGG